MKPHIKKINGIWYCAGAGVLVMGYTPAHAFALWKAEQA